MKLLLITAFFLFLQTFDVKGQEDPTTQDNQERPTIRCPYTGEEEGNFTKVCYYDCEGKKIGRKMPTTVECPKYIDYIPGMTIRQKG